MAVIERDQILKCIYREVWPAREIEGHNYTVSVLVDAEELTDDSDPCALQAIGIQELGVVPEEMTRTVGGSNSKYLRVGFQTSARRIYCLCGFGG